MQLIEQLFGISPDGGTGLTEIAVLAAALTGALLVYRRVTTGRRERIGRFGW